MKIICVFSICCLIASVLAAQQTIFFDDFENAVPKEAWTVIPNLEGENGTIEVVMSAAKNGDFGLRIGKSSDGDLTTNAIDLALDLSAYTEVEMTFWIRDLLDETQNKDGIYFSDDGGSSYTKVFDFDPEIWCGEYGQFPPFRIDQMAAANGLQLTDQFVIRFQQQGNDDFSSGAGLASQIDGFYIDDVNIYEPVLSYASLPFSDDFELGKWKESWAHRFADDTAFPIENVSTPENLVDVVNGIGLDNSFALRFGKRCDGGFVTNAMDLHLNLANLSDVELSFWIRDLRDETQNQDGLYFSDDGGVTFVKVFEFKPELWCGSYGQFPPFDVDQLAAIHNLELTDRFVIRFQQHGDDDFASSSGLASQQDGFYLDDVKVYESDRVHATLPYFQDFNLNELGPSLSWSFADQTAIPLTDISTPDGRIDLMNGIGLDESFALRMGKRCDGASSTNALDLLLDLSRETDVELTFWIRDLRDETQPQDGLYFSDDGGASFIKVFDFLPGEWCGNFGQFPPFDVDQLALEHGLSLTSQFIIRFQQHGEDDFSTTAGLASQQDGFYLDNISVYAPMLSYAVLPFTEDFESGKLESYWAWRFADATATPLMNVTSPENVVEVINGRGIDDSFAARLGKRCDEGFSTNALDLHLNVQGATEVALHFWMRDVRDETQAQDGLYFSDNAGVSFTKVFDFDFSNFSDSYTLYTIDVDSLSAVHGLNLTEQFIIRFQQHGEDDFFSSAGLSSQLDGMYIDNINITGMTTTPTKEPSLAKYQLKVTPNPAGDQVRISWDEPVADLQLIEVFSASGQRVLTVNPATDFFGSSFSLDVKTLSAGLYYIRTRSLNRIEIGSMIKL